MVADEQGEVLTVWRAAPPVVSPHRNIKAKEEEAAYFSRREAKD